MSSEPRKSTPDSKALEEALQRELGRALRPASRAPRKPTGMARRVSRVLVPVEPSQQFVNELGRGLMSMAARSRRSLIRRYRTAILVGAAIFGSIASVVGVVALIVRQRTRGMPRAG